jgi:hypothetical protein
MATNPTILKGVAQAILELYREVIEKYWKEVKPEPGPINHAYADSVV